MKAVDYHAEYLAAQDKRAAVLDIGRRFVEEIGSICEARKCLSAAAVLAVYQEQERKWDSFRSMIRDGAGTDPAPFAEFVKHFDGAFVGRVREMAREEERRRVSQNKAVANRLQRLGLL